MDALADAAEALTSQDAKTGDGPKLYKYLLPFVTVREVRSVWLGLTDAFAGDAQVAGDWAQAHGEASDDDTAEEDT